MEMGIIESKQGNMFHGTYKPISFNSPRINLKKLEKKLNPKIPKTLTKGNLVPVNSFPYIDTMQAW